jgi:Pentapeptide repeats (8 copies)
MTMPAQRKATDANTALRRRDVVRLLQQAGNPAQVDVSHHDVRGIALLNGNLRGANLSQASLCEANLCGADLSNTDLHGADLSGTYLCWADLHGANLREADLREADLSWACFGEARDSDQLKHRLWRRGAIFREAPNVSVAGRFSEGAGRHALGFALGFLSMSVVGFLCVVGLRLLFSLWLKRNQELARVVSRRGCV